MLQCKLFLTLIFKIPYIVYRFNWKGIVHSLHLFKHNLLFSEAKSKSAAKITFSQMIKRQIIVRGKNSSPDSSTGGGYCAAYNPFPRRWSRACWGGRGVLRRSWAEVPCHETVILPAIKVTSIHYWKWLPTLQTHLGECAVIREFVGDGRGTAKVEGRWVWGVTVSCPPQLPEMANIESAAAVCGLGVLWTGADG